MENIKNLDLDGLITLRIKTDNLINQKKVENLKKELTNIIDNYYPQAKDHKYDELVNMIGDVGVSGGYIEIDFPEKYTLGIAVETCEIDVFKDLEKNTGDQTSSYLRGFGEFLCGKKITTFNFSLDIENMFETLEEKELYTWKRFKR